MLAPASRSSCTEINAPGGGSTGRQWIARFAGHARDDHRVSANTLAAYTLDLELLSRWLAAQQQDLLELTPARLNRYLADRLGEGAHPSTVARHISSCRCFYGFLVQQQVIPANPALAVPFPRVPRRQPVLIPRDVLHQLLHPPHRPFPTPLSAFRARRDHAIVCTLYGTGLTTSEVRLLTWAQMDERRSVLCVQRPGGLVQSSLLDSSLREVLMPLRRHAAAVNLDGAASSYCFPTSSELPMTRQAMCQMIRRWAEACRSATVVTPSALRQAGRAHQTGKLRRPVDHPERL